MKLLLVHRTGPHGLGDRIRVEAILNFLRNKCYHVQEVRLPMTSFSLDDFLSTLPSTYLTPTYFSMYASLRDFRLSATLSIVYNYLGRILKSTKFDAVLTETTPIGWVVWQWLKKHHVSTPLLVDVHGLWFSETKGWGRQNWLMLKRAESETLREAYRLFVVSNTMKNFMTDNFNVDERKIVVVTNGCQPVVLSSTYEIPFKVIYAGIFDYYENISMYLDLAKNTRDKRIQFYMAGKGPLLGAILSRLRREKVSMCYMGYIPREKMLSILSSFQAGLVFSTKDLAREVAFPIKILDYASRGLPVICPKIGDWGHLVETEDIGICVDNGVAEYLGALQVLVNRRVWSLKRKNCIHFAERYQWRDVLQPMKRALDEL